MPLLEILRRWVQMRRKKRPQPSLHASLAFTAGDREPPPPVSLPNTNSEGSPGDPRGFFAGVDTLVEGRLGVAVHASHRHTLTQIELYPDVYFCSTTLQEAFAPVRRERGPVDISVIFRFVRYLREKDHPDNLQGRLLVYYCLSRRFSVANTAVLLGAYMMLDYGLSSAEAHARLCQTSLAPLADFPDLTGGTEYAISVYDTLRALEVALAHSFFALDTFDYDDYAGLARTDFPDATLIADRLLLFRGPSRRRRRVSAAPPKAFLPVFRYRGITAVLRLNGAGDYDAAQFTREGVHVHNLYIRHVDSPSLGAVREFLNICDQEPKLALHCHAGSGVEGVLAAIWLMRHRRLSAREAAAWVRLCRPGALRGRQLAFLLRAQEGTWRGNLLSLGSLSEESSDKSIPLSRASSTTPEETAEVLVV